jgi:hypothetical protein
MDDLALADALGIGETNCRPPGTFTKALTAPPTISEHPSRRAAESAESE